MPTETPNQKPKRRRYRTRMFDDRLSFPTTSEQVRQLQVESEAEGRSVASLIREAIDQFLPRLRKPGGGNVSGAPASPLWLASKDREPPTGDRAAALG